MIHGGPIELGNNMSTPFLDEDQNLKACFKYKLQQNKEWKISFSSTSPEDYMP